VQFERDSANRILALGFAIAGSGFLSGTARLVGDKSTQIPIGDC
jgi:hypothetical protein